MPRTWPLLGENAGAGARRASAPRVPERGDAPQGAHADGAKARMVARLGGMRGDGLRCRAKKRMVDMAIAYAQVAGIPDNDR